MKEPETVDEAVELLKGNDQRPLQISAAFGFLRDRATDDERAFRAYMLYRAIKIDARRYPR